MPSPHLLALCELDGGGEQLNFPEALNVQQAWPRQLCANATLQSAHAQYRSAQDQGGLLRPSIILSFW